MKEGSTVIASMRYLGLSTLVGLKYDAAADTELTYQNGGTGDGGDIYTGLDRFGRIIETLWKTGSTHQVHSKYGRNATGGIVWRQDVKATTILSPTTQDAYYEYDGLRQVTRHDRGQLNPGAPPYTGVTNLQQQEDFTYDATGNWKGYESLSPPLDQTREHNAANQITEIADPSGVVQPTYDTVGNMSTLPAPGDWTKAYTCIWDAWNRLVEIKDGPTLVQANTYDAMTRRIRKEGVETRDYYYDRQWRAVEERASDLVEANYVYSPTDRWTLIRRRRSTADILDETRYCLRDYLDPVAIIRGDGTVDERYSYDAFGQVRIMDANYSARASSLRSWNWLFHGEFLDEDSGMYDYGYRFYHPKLGRWLSRDPIGEEWGENLYRFVGNDGINTLDAFGLASLDKKSDGEPEMGKCGGFRWDIIFDWAGDAEASGGVILQEISLEIYVEDCNGNDITEAVWKRHFGDKVKNFHEVWDVWGESPGQVADGFRIAAPIGQKPGEFENCSRGSITATGWARYYPHIAFDDEKDKLRGLGWSLGNKKTLAGPTQWSGVANPGWRNREKSKSNLSIHSISVKWDCCPPNEHSDTIHINNSISKSK